MSTAKPFEEKRAGPQDRSGKKTPLNIAKNQNLRIIQKQLVYVIGLSSSLANKELLMKNEYFGQYGTITKLIVNKNKAYNPFGPNGPSFSAYITYSTCQEASIAILSVDNTTIDDHVLRASFGTTKYCTFYLKGLDCTNKDCLYLHYIADQKDLIMRDEMNADKSIFFDQQLLAMKIADIFNPEVKKKIKSVNSKKVSLKLPSSDTIYSKEIVIDNDPSGENFLVYNGLSGKRVKKYQGYEANLSSNNDSSFDRFSAKENSTERLKANISEEKLLVSERKISDSFSNANTTSAVSNKSKLNSLFKSKESFKMAKKENNVNSNGNNLTPIKGGKEEIPLDLIRSKSDLNNNSSIKRTLFEWKEKSRFGFVAGKENRDQVVEIPKEISEIINKKVCLHYYLSRYSFDFEESIERKLSSCKSQDWVQFIQGFQGGNSSRILTNQ